VQGTFDGNLYGRVSLAPEARTSSGADHDFVNADLTAVTLDLLGQAADLDVQWSVPADGLEFQAAASDSLGMVHAVDVTNTSRAPVQCQLQVTGPFALERAQQQTLPVSLAPLQTVTVRVLHVPRAGTAPSGSLHLSAGGGELLQAPLRTAWHTPSLSVAPAILDAGTCFIGSACTHAVELRNTGLAPAAWKAESSDPQVAVEPSHGVMRAATAAQPTARQQLQLTVRPTGAAVCATVRITSAHSEAILEVTAKGSFDEHVKKTC
jgi:hypothetical protein